ncbi:hypothetical protein WOLCODRAFT_152015 [Wolfiporia cocos MD-104 SS10]|uniref:Retrotransposon gag domain-containing protein n=1 Tax=Wolfiporia cocos (strain MD-104) TaxID=742152 RepID=A0A2H3JK99_WOLCO|nr:hypothetical protein WOLCODRAFT_152015 [Wolfiporia cocos MD-104 SS10]
MLESQVDDETFPPVPIAPLPNQVTLPAAFGPYQLLVRDRIREIEYPSLTAAMPCLTRGLTEEDAMGLPNKIAMAYNAVMESADVAAVLAEEAQRMLASRLDSRFQTLFKRFDTMRTYIRTQNTHITRLEQDRQSAVWTAPPAMATQATGPTQAAFDALLARVVKLESQPTPTAPTAAATSFVMAPKATPPPEFSGDGAKILVNEWLKKCIMYFGAYPITDDRQKIIQALQHLSGSTFDYQEEKIKNAADPTKSLGTWAEFEEEMLRVYGKKTEEELAKKEIEGYFGSNGKKKANANFYQYVEHLRQLAKKAKTPNDTLCEKLKDTIPDKVRDGFSMMRIFGQSVPTDWEKYLDTAIEMHKDFYREDIQGSIFEKEKKEKEKEKEKASTQTRTISSSQTSKTEKSTSGGEKSTQSVPTGSVPGSIWKQAWNKKWYLWAPAHKCAICGCDNCESGGTQCRQTPVAKTTTAAATTTTYTKPTSRNAAPPKDGKKRFVREIREYYTSDEESSPAPSTTATVGVLETTSVSRIEEMTEEEVLDQPLIPVTGQPIIHHIPRLAPAGSSGFFESRM